MIIIPVHCNDSDKDNDDDGDDDNDKYTNSNLISCNNHFIIKSTLYIIINPYIVIGGGGSIPLPLIFWSRIFTITTCTNCKTHFHNCSSIMNTSFDTD